MVKIAATTVPIVTNMDWPKKKMLKGMVTEGNWKPAMHSAKMLTPLSVMPQAVFMMNACHRLKSLTRVT